MRSFPVRETSGLAWDLRGAWAAGKEIVVVLDPEWAVVDRVRGRIVYVATTGAFALVADGGGEPMHVPLEIVLAIRRPHFSEPLDSPPRRVESPTAMGEQLTLDIEAVAR